MANLGLHISGQGFYVRQAKVFHVFDSGIVEVRHPCSLDKCSSMSAKRLFISSQSSFMCWISSVRKDTRTVPVDYCRSSENSSKIIEAHSTALYDGVLIECVCSQHRCVYSQNIAFPPVALWVTVGLAVCLLGLLIALAAVCRRKIKESCEEARREGNFENPEGALLNAYGRISNGGAHIYDREEHHYSGPVISVAE
ncbi:hypothetical protein GOODEAATRI_004277 [Goodea atripinnis]|uniref:Uncharacterized protein n=1 Tax=Goodea atripinnis TaxID=208336 RepID=A0ABV0P4Y3_9TELE